MARRLDAALRFAPAPVAVLGFLLAAALVAVNFNTIRLQPPGETRSKSPSSLARPIPSSGGRFYGSAPCKASPVGYWRDCRRGHPSMNRDLTALAALYSLSFQLAGPRLPDVATLLGWFALLAAGAWLSVARSMADRWWRRAKQSGTLGPV